MITGRFRKLIYPMLIDNDPVRQAYLFAFQRFRIIYGGYGPHGDARNTQMILLPQVFVTEIFC